MLCGQRIHINANGGAGAPGPQTKGYDVDVYLSNLSPTAPYGYSFYGWSTSSAGTTPDYGSGGHYAANGNITLYAVYIPNTYIINYNANGGTEAPDYQYITHDQFYFWTTSVPTRAGHHFLGWAENSTATTPTYYAGERAVGSYNMTVYAVWTTQAYSITYNANGGTGAPISQKKGHNLEFRVSSIKPMRTGCTFLGWSTSSSAVVATYASGANLASSLNSNLTLYAVWEYTITYDANGGTGAPSSQVKAHNAEITLSSVQPMRAGHIFMGWSTSSAANIVNYSSGDTVYSWQNYHIALYAVWTTHTYTIIYNANGGYGAPSSQTKGHDVDLYLSNIYPTAPYGYSFYGWSTSATATNPDYGNGGYYNTNGNVTLYAVYMPDTYIINYNANGGNGGLSYQYVKFNEQYTWTTSVPTRTGHHFLGWSESSTAITPNYYAGENAVGSYNMTAYAVWATQAYTITYNANGGTGAPISQKKGYNLVFRVSSIKPTRAGRTFLGWSTSPSATVATYASGANLSASLNSNLTLYAVWA